MVQDYYAERQERQTESNAALSGRNPGKKIIKYVQPSVLQASHCSNDAKITAVDNAKLQTIYKLELEITGLLKISNRFKKKPQAFQLSWAELIYLYCKGKTRKKIIQTLIYQFKGSMKNSETYDDQKYLND